jgi:hypothetical protein
MWYSAVPQQRQHLTGVRRAWYTQQFEVLHGAISKMVLMNFSTVAQSSPTSLMVPAGLCLKCIVEQMGQVAKGEFAHSRRRWE